MTVDIAGHLRAYHKHLVAGTNLLKLFVMIALNVLLGVSSLCPNGINGLKYICRIDVVSICSL